MSQIFEKCRTKRSYKRKPQCENKLKICEYNQCRCNYAYDLQKVAQGKVVKPWRGIIMEGNFN